MAQPDTLFGLRQSSVRVDSVTFVILQACKQCGTLTEYGARRKARPIGGYQFWVSIALTQLESQISNQHFLKHFADLLCGQLYGDSPLELCGCHTPSLGWLCLCWWRSEAFWKLNNDGIQFLKLYKELLYDIFLEVYTVDIHDHAKILWPQLQEGTNHWGRGVIVGFWITQDRGIWHCGLQFNHKKNFICYYMATTGWCWLELWSAMYTLWRQGFFNWIVARAGGYSCGSGLLIHLECTNFAIPWTATVAVRTLRSGFVPNCHSSVLACGSPCGLQLQFSAKSWCPSIMSITLALHCSWKTWF